MRRALSDAFSPARRLVASARRGASSPPQRRENIPLNETQELTGLLIALEGLDGSGKTTQATRITRELQRRGHSVSQYKEPGDTPTGRFLQRYLSDGGPQHPVAAAGLFLAAHAEIMHDAILPDLHAGRIVIMDRFTPSCLAYQCFRDHVPEAPILQLHHHVQPPPLPAHYLFLDLKPEVSVARSQGRHDQGHDPNELADQEARAITRHGYLHQISRDPDHWSIIDANASWDSVAYRILAECLDIISNRI